MNNKNDKQHSGLSARMVEDEATEKLKKRARDWGLIVNAGAGKANKVDKGGKKEGKR